MTDYQTRAYAKQEVTDITYILVTRFDKRKTSLQQNSLCNQYA